MRAGGGSATGFAVDVSDVASCGPALVELEEAAGLAPGDGWLAAVADRVADAAVRGDGAAMVELAGMVSRLEAAAARVLPAEERREWAVLGGVVAALADQMNAGRSSFPSSGPHARLLAAIAANPGGSGQHLAEASGLGTAVVAELGARLSAAGLVSAVTLGCPDSWSVSPRGRRIANQLVHEPGGSGSGDGAGAS